MNIPLLPDKSYKLLLLVGIGLIIYGWINEINEQSNYEHRRIEYNLQIKELKNEAKYLKEDLKEIYERTKIIALKYSRKNPLIISDTGYTFNRAIKGDNISIKLSDSIETLLDSYMNKNKEFERKNDEVVIKEYELENLKDTLDGMDNLFSEIIVMGIILSFLGFISWSNFEDFEKKIIKRQNIHLPTFSNRCQSCGKHFNSVVKYGTEKKNEEKNYNFCLSCYKNGEFTNKDLTFDEMKTKCVDELRAKHKNKVYIKLYILILRTLDRWN